MEKIFTLFCPYLKRKIKEAQNILKLSFLFLIFCSLQIAAQQRITGKVTDEITGNPLAGVTVQVKGTLTGTISQVDGTYDVTMPSGTTTLVFSFVGYQTQEIAVAGRTVIDITMVEEITALEEVVITGYSTERKKDIIGSVAVVNTEEMLSTPSGSMSNQLQGRAAGVTVSGSGEAGGSARVRIRGFGTFTESVPLYIIDGTPGDINRVNPNDVESVQVLKDAASSAVYGARAANGVVIVTTKKGTAGASKISFDAYYGWQYMGEKWYPDVLDANEFGELYWKAMEGAGLSFGDPGWLHPQYGSGPEPAIPEYILVNDNGAYYGGAALEGLKTSDPALFNSLVDPDNYDLATHQIVKSGNTNWAREMYDPAPIQNYQISVSGGNEKNTYLISVNYFDQGSITTEYTYYRRYTARANNTLAILDRLRIGENLQVSYSKQRNLDYNINAWTFHPLIPLYDIAGNMASTAAPGLVGLGGTEGHNPVVDPSTQKSDYTENTGMFGNVFAELDIIQGLTFRSSFGFDVNARETKDFARTQYEHNENNRPEPDRLDFFNNIRHDWVWTNTATYSKTFGKHVVKLLAGTEAVKNKLKDFNLARYNYTPDLQQYDAFIVLDAGTGQQLSGGTTTLSGLWSQFGRIDYNYGDKYILNATVRRDGSSKFGIENRYGVFPSVAIGWRISAEPFMQNLTWLTDLKLRASMGIIGNQTGLSVTNKYSLFTGSDFYGYPIQGGNNSRSLAYALSTVGNRDAKWEKTKTTNVGLDATFLQGKLSLSGEYYIRETSDLLVPNQPPATGTEARQPYVNVGTMWNKGVDITASYRGVVFGELGYEVTANFTKYKNNVTKILDNPLSSIIVAGTGQYINYSRTIVGYPIAHFYGYKIDGFFNSQAEVDAYKAQYDTYYITPRVGGWRIKDISGPDGVPDNKVNDYDRTMIGSPHPDFQTNLSLSLNWKGLDLYVNAFWNQGGAMFNSMRHYVDFFSFMMNRSERMLNDSWTPENKNAKLPALNIYDNTSFKYSNDYFIEDATYFRIRTIQLGYSLPGSLTNKIKVDRLRVYVQSQNPFTWCKEYTGMDPDAGFSSGSDLQLGTVGGETPTPQQILLGVNLSF